MSIFEAILQGIVQGLTEFLPVSSSGHLSLLQHFFGLDGENAVTITLVLHMGTLIAVFFAFREKIIKLVLEFFRMVKDIFTGKFKCSEMNGERRMICMLVISILPLFIFYIFKDFFEGLASDADIVAEGLGFLYTSALLFISTARSHDGGKYTCGEMKVKNALIIGIFQGFALMPGISRSGSTIGSGMLTGLKKEDSVEYSFILGLPVILAGSLLEIKDVASAAETVGILPLIVCFVVSAVVGYFAIILIKLLVTSNKFRIFAYYTLVLGIAVLCIGIYEQISGTRIGFIG